MNLFKWIKNIKPVFPNLLEKFRGKKIDEQASEDELIATVPSVNINDKGKKYELSLAVPGMDKSDIKIQVEDNCLIISSEKQYEKEESEGIWMRREFGYASFQRMFELPADANANEIEAKFKDGILKINISKTSGKENEAKYIDVK
jgi:HSP20 family protein